MHDFFWFVIFPGQTFAMGLCLGRHLTEAGIIPIDWPRKRTTEDRPGDK